MPFFYRFILCLLSIPALAQYKERPAELLNRNDEIRSGLIRDYDWHKSPEFIEFVSKGAPTVSKLSIRTIQRLTIKEGPVYEGLYLPVPYYAKNPVRSGTDIIDRTDSTYYLSELLLESQSVRLYRFFDADAKVRFVVSKYDSLILLHNIEISLLRGQRLYNFSDPAYRQQLRTALNECPTLNTDNVLYTEASLIGLLKEYLSFCRIDSKVHLEQKKLGRVVIGLGALAASWETFDGLATGFGLSAQLLLPRRLHNVFTLIDVSRFTRESDLGQERGLHVGLYAGRYFGSRVVQAKLYTGLSTIAGPLDTGVGISYRKMVSAEVRYPVFYGLLNGFRETDRFYIRPLVNLRVIVPLNRSN